MNYPNWATSYMIIEDLYRKYSKDTQDPIQSKLSMVKINHYLVKVVTESLEQQTRYQHSMIKEKEIYMKK